MRKLTYLAVFEPSGKGYSVYFPDLPGCISYGDTFLSAQREAEDALGLHIYGMEKDGDPIPAPSERPVVDPDTVPGFLVAPVTIFPSLVRDEIDNRRVKTNCTIPSWVKDIALEHNLNCSRLLEAAILDTVGIQKHK